ncbi:hypothetical protein PUN28_007816 [Cardiocondyla obscurior]|uniref:Odorant receptor n=4 Tax=Cardiocondyla obscurior TaxID=286306 RepID=A0AAW2FXS5_9HYME
MREILLKEVISFVRLSVFIIQCWPLPENASRLRVVCVKLYHCACIMILTSLSAALIYTILNNLKNVVVLANTIIITSATFHANLNFLFYNINYHHLKKVTFGMERFSNSIKPHEGIVIQRYIVKCVPFYASCVFVFYFMALLTAVLPIVKHQPFPTTTEYPFDVLYQPVTALICAQQIISAFLVTGQLCQNVFMALLIWFASIRFEMLIEELKTATNAYQLFECIRKHQELLEYGIDISIATRPFAFITICCSTTCTITNFLLLLKEHSLILAMWFIGLSVIGLIEVFMYTWPAEHLIHTVTEVGHAAFEIFEKHYFVKIWKCLQIFIMRNQKPIVITIPCLMPALSFNYFAAYLSTILSYFTTLRVVMVDDEE